VCESTPGQTYLAVAATSGSQSNGYTTRVKCLMQNNDEQRTWFVIKYENFILFYFILIIGFYFIFNCSGALVLQFLRTLTAPRRILNNFIKFRPEKYDFFDLYKRFFMEEEAKSLTPSHYLHVSHGDWIRPRVDSLPAFQK
jgi:hypothetical protein